MTSGKKGQIIAIVGLLLGATVYWHFRSRPILLDYLAVGIMFMFVVGIVLSYILPLENPRITRNYILAISAWIICTLLGGLLLMKGADITGLLFILVGLVIYWGFVRRIGKRIRRISE
jgi:hypothetical protein